ncbi:hypothetical protein CHS0354_017765 [Potamilus streckersoni]|uniref:Uncharacterized protein n=1 Tax=Potamilus streckersoni TaxID=2493646 RepID=A0AAE0T901_9BIVA|nr:hypothetical protein CHS0354_017765 [Potamilus streckersoni]
MTLQDTVKEFMKKEQTWEQKEQEFIESIRQITQLKHQIERYEQQAVEYNILQQHSKLLEKECSDLRYECSLLKKAKQDGVKVLKRKKMEDSKSLKHTVKEKYVELDNLFSEKLDSGNEGFEKHLYHKDEDLVKKSYHSKSDLGSLKTKKVELQQSLSQSLFNVKSALTELTDLSKQLEEAENKCKVLNEMFDKDGVENKEHGECQIAMLDASIKDLEECKVHQKKQQTDYSVLQTDYSVLQHDYSVLQTDYSVLQHDYSVLQADYSVLQADYSVLQAEFQKDKDDVNDKYIQETQKKDTWSHEVEKLKNIIDEMDENVEQLNNASISALEQLTAENELKSTCKRINPALVDSTRKSLSWFTWDILRSSPEED